MAAESEDDSDIPCLVSDSEDELIIVAVEISFDAQPKRETFRNNYEEDLPTLGSPEKIRESEPNIIEKESAFAQPKAGSLRIHTYGTKNWQPCDWPDVCLRNNGVIGSPVDR